MIRLLMAIAIATLAVTAECGPPSPSNSLRSFADSTAALIADGEDDQVFLRYATVTRQAYSKDELITPLKRARKLFGKIEVYRPTNVTQPGFRFAKLQRLEMVRYWYSVSTARCHNACYLQVDVTVEDSGPTLAGFSIVRFQDGKVPPQLR